MYIDVACICVCPHAQLRHRRLHELRHMSRAKAGIPINATTAFDKATSKADDGDVSELFLNVQSIRWIIIDEVSISEPEGVNENA